MATTELTILYVTDSTVTVYPPEKQSKLIEFPKKIVEGKNILDKEAFYNLLIDQLFMIENKEIVVVLGSGILYQHAVVKGSIDDNSEDFYAQLPFGEHSVIKKIIETDIKRYFLASNKDYIETFVQAALNFKATLHAVIPLSLFTDNVERQDLSDSLLAEIRQNSPLFHAGDFLSEGVNAKVEEEKKEEPKSEVVDIPATFESTEDMRNTSYKVESGWSKGGILFFFFLILLSVAVAVGGYFFLTNTKMSFSPEPTPTPTSAPTATPTPEPLEKSEVTVEIQNGTGTAGQAGRASAVLEDIDYEDIEVGNADTEDAETTSITFSSRVSQDQQQELITALEEIFEEVSSSVKADQEKDVIIITGIEKE